MSRAIPSSSPGSRMEAALTESSATCASCPAGLVLDFDDELDLHGCIERQRRSSHRAPGMPARVAEDLKQQLACAVHNLRLPGEVWRASHEAGQLDDSIDR